MSTPIARAAPADANPPRIAGIPVVIAAGRPSTPAEPLRGLPLLRLGFRPFYLGAAAFAAAAMLLWVAVLAGSVALPGTLPAVWWHAHEMLFGFVAAVVVGFLLTAGKAWTNLPTPRGAMLGFLAGLWLAARGAALWAPYPVFFLLDVALLPLVAALFVDILVRSGNKRNAAVGAVLVLLGVANLLFHLGAIKAVPVDPLRAVYGGVALVVVLESIIGGRVIPSFTMNATPGLVLTESRRRDLCAIVLGAAGLALWVFDGPRTLGALVLGAAALLHAWRAWSWKPWVTFTRPILWILHLAYAWIPVGLALLAASQAGWLSASPALHALTVGSMGGLIIAMITRTARGHTGRPLQASRAEVVAYGLVLVAAVLRVSAPLVLPAFTLPALVGAGVAWAAAFVLYLGRFTPWLLTTRLDGRDG